MRYYIADLHFFHSRLNEKMDFRGFESCEAMNEYMISQWNSRVKSGDEVVILGDFSISKSAEEVMDVLKRLNGKKYLIRGNHDQYLDSNEFDASLFQWIEPYKEMNDNRRKVILSHYPVMCYNGQYRRDEEGNARVYMLYGHVHNTFDEYLVNEMIRMSRGYRREIKGSEEMLQIPCQMINCFCMFSDYVPLTLDEWITLDEKRREKLSLSDYDSVAEKYEEE